MATWEPPDGVTGDSSFIRVSVGMLGPARYRCPARDALAARPRSRPGVQQRRKPEYLENFTNGSFMDAMDLIEHTGASVDEALRRLDTSPGRRVHDGVRQWTAHALRGYREAFPSDTERGMRSVESRWSYDIRLPAPDARGATRYQITVWGRCYVSLDERVRELRLVVNRLRARARTDAEIAVAARVLASGGPGAPPEQVRIMQFGIDEGKADTLFDGSRKAALDLYEVAGKAALAELVDGGQSPTGMFDYRPGSACVECPYAGVCPALQRTPGLLGVDGRTRPRRSWSATNARNYASCPAREHLRRHRLPVDVAIERDAATERGRAIHRYLENLHSANPITPCVPRVPEDWVPEDFALSTEDRVLGRRLLLHHSEVCPNGPARKAEETRVEPDLVYDDSVADVVVLAKPDLLYRDSGGWVWREVKTSASQRRWSQAWFSLYPQLALAVVLVSRGVFGGGQGRVELEVLRPEGVDLITFDPFTTDVRQAAERALHEHVRDWHADDRFEAKPGKQCASCEVARWCTARKSSGAGE